MSEERFTATKLMVGQYLLATEGMVVFICVLCCVMGIVLFGFFGWHLYLVKAGEKCELRPFFSRAWILVSSTWLSASA